ncbi:Hypothetical predicted protein [Pelobates cultripes]|uniref:Uncharacterized protein n=1 Tax=Pelobates cultripes TaxID=61616 RepID=A0AAD1VL35_PELCU|nr:Hypothetical predicted protein [Pelobates cultripes]
MREEGASKGKKARTHEPRASEKEPDVRDDDYELTRLAAHGRAPERCRRSGSEPAKVADTGYPKLPTDTAP